MKVLSGSQWEGMDGARGPNNVLGDSSEDGDRVVGKETSCRSPWTILGSVESREGTRFGMTSSSTTPPPPLTINRGYQGHRDLWGCDRGVEGMENPTGRTREKGRERTDQDLR